jgi:hypothetical protein
MATINESAPAPLVTPSFVIGSIASLGFLIGLARVVADG